MEVSNGSYTLRIKRRQAEGRTPHMELEKHSRLWTRCKAVFQPEFEPWPEERRSSQHHVQQQCNQSHGTVSAQHQVDNMAPLRRYLRITKHSVLEVRIYLDRPSDVEAWLLRRNNAALPRIIQAIRPLILPKLREENERARGGGGKAAKRGFKDIVAQGLCDCRRRIRRIWACKSNVAADDFEVSIFLTEPSSRHSILTRRQSAQETRRLASNSGKLTSWLTTGTSDKPVAVDQEPVVLREDDAPIHLDDIPEVSFVGERPSRTPKHRSTQIRPDEHHSTSESDDGDVRNERPEDGSERDAMEARDDKKDLGLRTAYDGFSIYGRILCLVVKRKERQPTGGGWGEKSSQTMLENWVSTQAAAEQADAPDEEEG